jgi:hypothetical protein
MYFSLGIIFLAAGSQARFITHSSCGEDHKVAQAISTVVSIAKGISLDIRCIIVTDLPKLLKTAFKQIK